MNRNVIVTGGSGDMGSALVRHFAALGDWVFFSWNTSEKEAEALISELKGKRVASCRADISDPASVRAFEKASEEFFIGPPDILINNAGMSLTGLITEMPDEDIARVINVNLTGTILVTKAFLPSMTRAGRGDIVNISSIWGNFGAACECAYSASKAGVNGFTRSLAREVSYDGIRVNAVAAGFIDTRMTAAYTDEEREAFCEDLAVKRTGTVQDVVNAVDFLVSGKSSYMSGQILGVDGGYNI